MPLVPYSYRDPLKTAGRNKTVLVPMISDLAAPKMAELDEGFEIQCGINGIAWSSIVSKNTTTGRDVICQEQETSKIAPESLGSLQLQFWYDPQLETDPASLKTEELITLLTPQNILYVFDRGGLPYTAAFAADQYGTAARLQVNGSLVPVDIDTSTENAYAFTVDFAVLGLHTLTSKIAA